MPRIRTIKPEFFTSATISSIADPWARLQFVGELTYVDDKGRGRDDARLLKAALFPLDDDVTVGDVGRWQEHLAGAGLIERYEVEDRAYFRVRGWTEHQRINRPSPSKLPASPEECVKSHRGLTEDSLGEAEAEAEQGNGKGSGGGTTSDTRDVSPHGVEEETRRRISRRRAKGEDIGPRLEELIRQDVIREFAAQRTNGEAHNARRSLDHVAAAEGFGRNMAAAGQDEDDVAEDLRRKFGDDDAVTAGLAAYRQAVTR